MNFTTGKIDAVFPPSLYFDEYTPSCARRSRASRDREEEEVYQQQQPTTGFLLCVPLGQVNGHQPLDTHTQEYGLLHSYLSLIVVHQVLLYIFFCWIEDFFLKKEKEKLRVVFGLSFVVAPVKGFWNRSRRPFTSCSITLMMILWTWLALTLPCDLAFSFLVLIRP